MFATKFRPISLEGSKTTTLLPPAIVVMGDHGMADGGGHGGSTIPEVLVPFLVISGSLTMQSEVNILVISGSLTTQSEVSIAVCNRPVPRHFRFTDSAE
jgi:hypothetical protein